MSDLPRDGQDVRAPAEDPITTAADLTRDAAVTERRRQVDAIARRLPSRARGLILQGLAEHLPTRELQRRVESLTGLQVTTGTVAHYRQAPRWQETIRRLRQDLEADLDRLPMSSRHWRQSQRGKVFKRAMRNPDASGLAAARGVLMDAYKDSPQGVEDNQRVPAVVLQVLNLPAEALRQLAGGGPVDPATYLPDVRACRAGLTEVPLWDSNAERNQSQTIARNLAPSSVPGTASGPALDVQALPVHQSPATASRAREGIDLVTDTDRPAEVLDPYARR